jgi:hypothetical protein
MARIKMDNPTAENSLWRYLFFGLVLVYGFYYAPYGVNETDGGFLTGLAWQVLQGKNLYQDVVYVRPPLPVWLRALELYLLPEHYGILGERWIFYLKVGLYSWMAAGVLAPDHRRWVLATFGFVVSAHCYPPMAWHTVDGILFAVAAVYVSFRPGVSRWHVVLGGVTLLGAALCKQSFFPLLVLIPLLLWWFYAHRVFYFLLGLGAALLLFSLYLLTFDLVDGFFSMTTGAATGGQALQHGLLDYAHITPELAVPSLGLWVFCAFGMRRNMWQTWVTGAWYGWLAALIGSFGVVIWLRQDHTAPFAQSRVLFCLTTCVVLYTFWRDRIWQKRNVQHGMLPAAALLSISWCAAISWGYNLPLLFASPWIWGAMKISEQIPVRNARAGRWLLLLLLLAVFRLGHEFVYRDGLRRNMTIPLGDIFPRLSGIYSDSETAARYRELKRLTEKYGVNFTVLPAFPQANYLTNTYPLLPLDWIVNRETNGDNYLIYNALNTYRPVCFVERNYQEKWLVEEQLQVTRRVVESGKLLERTTFFDVIQIESPIP